MCFSFGREDDDENDEIVNVAIIGKPNVGKSSLVNKISGTNRAIVSNIAGTTRDTTDTFVENEYGKFNFIDTAGLRRKSKVNDVIEKYSIIRARMAVERANVCVIMIDGTEGFTEQDSKVAGIALEQGKACIIVVNKWYNMLLIAVIVAVSGILLMLMLFKSREGVIRLLGVNLLIDGILNLCTVQSTVKTIRRRNREWEM